MLLAVFYQPEYEYDILNHRRKMITICQSQNLYIQIIFYLQGACDEHPKHTQGGTCNGSN